MFEISNLFSDHRALHAALPVRPLRGHPGGGRLRGRQRTAGKQGVRAGLHHGRGGVQPGRQHWIEKRPKTNQVTWGIPRLLYISCVNVLF